MLVCCLCVITFVPEIIRRVTFGQPLWIMVVFVVFVFFNSSWLLIIVNRGGKFLKKLWCCLGRRVYLDNLVLSIELIRFKKMTFWVLALHQSNWADKQIVSFSTHHDSKFTLSINSADNMKLFWYNYKMLPLILLITLGHLLVPLFVTVIVFHNWYIVTVVLLLPFSDFLTLSLIQGLFSWTQETLYKVEGLAVFFSLIFETYLHFVNLYVFNNLFAGNNCVLFPYVKILHALIVLISMWVLIILPGNVMSRPMHYIIYLKCANIGN